MLNLMWLLLGLALLTFGGEAVVRGALAAAKRLGVSPLLAGLAIVGFGTSAPELVVSVKASLSGQPEIALGNVIGSNIANILLILGIGALITPLAIHLHSFKRDGFTLIVSCLLFMGLASFGGLSRWEGLVMVLGLVGYLVWAYKTEREDIAAGVETEPEVEMPQMAIPLILLYLLIGFAMLIYGADRFLLGAIGLAKSFGVSDAVIGLTVVAVGTSLPELAATIVAAWRRHTDVVVGNVLGSNIFNLLNILGVAAIIQPIPFGGRLMAVDQWIMLAVSVALLVFLWFGMSLNRWKGAVFLLAYVSYVGVMFGLQN